MGRFPIFADEACSDAIQRLVESNVRTVEQYSEDLDVKFTIEQRLEALRVPGLSLAVIKDFHIYWAKGYGFASKGVPMEADTVLQVASVSKFVTAVATLRLVEKGFLDLDTDVNQYLNSWKVPENEFSRLKPVTLRGILSHTAGLNVPTFPGYTQGQAVPNTTDILLGAPESSVNTEPINVGWLPGAKESYSGGGTVVEQLLIQEFALRQGMSFEEYLWSEVLEPLGMLSSTFEVKNREDIASGHVCEGDSVKEVPGKWHTYPEKAAAGMYSTASDISRFLIHIARAYHGEPGSILAQDTVREMLTLQIEEGRFGLGATLFGVGTLPEIWFGHEGSNKGFCLQALANVEGNGVVAITNGDCVDSPAELLVTEAMATVLTAYGWVEERDLQAMFTRRFHIAPRMRVQPPQTGPQDYTGVYTAQQEVAPPFIAAYHVTENSIRPQEPGSCAFRLWPQDEFHSKFVTDMWYHVIPRPVIRFARGALGKVSGIDVQHGDTVVKYTRQDPEL